MGDCYVVRRGGSGAALRVVNGNVRPASPSKNTIWIDTDIPITDTILENNPQISVPHKIGRLIIGTNDSGPAELRLTDKPNSKVYLKLNGAHISDGNVWKSVNAYLWDSSKQWVQFSNAELILYKNGDESQSITGGWVSKPSGWDAVYSKYGDRIAPSVTRDPSSMTFYYPKRSGYYHGVVMANKPIDLTGVKTLLFSGRVTNNDPVDWVNHCADFVVWNRFSDQDWIKNMAACIKFAKNSDGTFALDVSKLDGLYDVGFGMRSSNDDDVRIVVRSVVGLY